MSSPSSTRSAVAAAVVASAALYWAVMRRRAVAKAAARAAAPPMYVSTRGALSGVPPSAMGLSPQTGQPGVSFEYAVMQGLAANGGLFVPQRVPKGDVEGWRNLSFPQLALEIMSLFVPAETCTRQELERLVKASYGANFRDSRITPVVGLDKEQVEVLELFHGPTWAFKDVALQFLGNLFEHILAKRTGDDARITVLGATSGDTGSAAIHGLRGKHGVECFILFPEGRVSPIQERQMTTIPDKNVHCVAIRGTFDDAQDIVKAAFNDREFQGRHRLAAVNSINWARILAQVTYYFFAYYELQRQGKSVDKLVFVVPTGNFGDVLAGYYAKRMGLPVHKFVVATNENDILHRFFMNGTYSRRDVAVTTTPSMDICVSSNFERFLYHMLEEDPKRIEGMMRKFAEQKEFSVSDEELKRCRAEMVSARASQNEVKETMRRVFSADSYLLDPHTAVGVAGAKELRDSGVLPKDARVVCLATAHWAKFTAAAVEAVGEKAVQDLYPAELKALEGLTPRKVVVDATYPHVRQEMEKVLGR